MTWLSDAATHGADFMQNCFINKIVSKNGKIEGISGIWEGKKLFVKAEIVVACCGSIHNPALLKRSGLRVRKT